MTIIAHSLAAYAAAFGARSTGRCRGFASGRDGLARSRRPGPSRPAGAPPRYHGTGVAMSVAPHRRRPVTLATTLGLALVAGIITLWLGLVANIGQAVNGDSAGSAAQVPDRLAVVRVEPGESLQDVAAPGGAGRAGPPGCRAHSRTQRPELTSGGRGPDADRAGRLTAANREKVSIPTFLGPRRGEHAPVVAALAQRGSPRVRSECSATPYVSTAKERSCTVRSAVIPIPG